MLVHISDTFFERCDEVSANTLKLACQEVAILILSKNHKFTSQLPQRNDLFPLQLSDIIEHLIFLDFEVVLFQ